MKEFIEEFGGVICACILGMAVLEIISQLTGKGGELSWFIMDFLRGIGTKVC